MSSGIIAFVGLLYTAIAIEQFYKGNPGIAITYLGYAFSNIGLFMVAK